MRILFPRVRKNKYGNFSSAPMAVSIVTSRSPTLMCPLGRFPVSRCTSVNSNAALATSTSTYCGVGATGAGSAPSKRRRPPHQPKRKRPRSPSQGGSESDEKSEAPEPPNEEEATVGGPGGAEQPQQGAMDIRIWGRGFGKPDQQHRVSGQINFAHLLAEYTQLRCVCAVA